MGVVDLIKRPPLPDQLSRAELIELAQQYVDNKLWTMYDVPEDMILSVFMVVALGGLRGYSHAQLGQIVVYEFIDKAGPMAINGYPIFMSCQLMLLKDFKVMVGMAKKIYEARQIAVESLKEG